MGSPHTHRCNPDSVISGLNSFENKKDVDSTNFIQIPENTEKQQQRMSPGTYE